MRGRGPYHMVVTPIMRAHLEHLRTILAELDFKIFTVSEPMRRSNEDFIAVSTGTRVCALIVRPCKNGKIELRCFQEPVLFKRLKAHLKERRQSHHSYGPLFFGTQLPFGERTLGWAQYVHPECYEELKMFFGITIEPRR